MHDIASPGLAAGGGLAAFAAAASAVLPRTVHTFECFDAVGVLRWREEVANLTTNAGLADMLSKYWKGAAYSAAFYVGLKGTGTIAAGDTMASHAGWSEVAPYGGARPALTLGSVTGTTTASADNSASKASYAITGSATIAGAFVTTDATASGTAGTLIGASDFAASRAVLSGDTLNVTITVSNTSG